MSLHKFAWRVVAVVTAMVASPVAIGQVYHPHGDPLDFNPNWQWFAPVDEWEMEELQMLSEIQERNAYKVERFFDSQRSLLASTPTIWPVR